MTYALLNVPFLLVAVVVLLVARRRTGRPGWAAVGLTLAVMLTLTAVFDNVMIAVGLVAYDDAQRLGLQVGVAPVEDFAYTLAAGLLLPAVWALLGGGAGPGEPAPSSGAGTGVRRADAPRTGVPSADAPRTGAPRPGPGRIDG